MDKISIDYVEEISATVLRTRYKDFTGEDWQSAYFKLLTWRNVWGMAYELDLLADNEHSAYVKLIVKQDIKKKVVDMLYDLGYGKVSVEDITLAQIEVGYDTDAYHEVVLA